MALRVSHWESVDITPFTESLSDLDGVETVKVEA